MLEAKVNAQIVQASPDSPDRARCSQCGAPVAKRKRSRMGGAVAHFYRHVWSKE